MLRKSIMTSDSISNLKSAPIPSKEEDELPNSTATLLPFDIESSSSISPSSKESTNRVLFICLNLSTGIALSAAFAFAFLFFSSAASSSPSVTSQSLDQVSRPLTKLKHPVVLLISSNGFRFGYQSKTHTPNINRLIVNGTEAELGLILVFPSLTFSNHYLIVTGLYPAYHGIINNYFLDPDTSVAFTMASHDPNCWLGEPMWETVTNHGLKASTLFSGLVLR